MRKQCVPDVLSPLPSERLGTRLVHVCVCSVCCWGVCKQWTGLDYWTDL